MNQHTPRHRESRPPEKPSESSSALEFKQYRRARLDGYCVVNALLALKFEGGIRDLPELEAAIQKQFRKRTDPERTVANAPGRARVLLGPQL